MVTQKLLDLVKEFEGCRLEAYPDPKGIWTIGYGDTGPAIKEGLVWTQEAAESTLIARLMSFAGQVQSCVEVEINQNQLDALTSFSYNLGIGALKSSHLLTLLNQADFVAAANEFDLWVHIGHSVAEGLVRRRAAEKALFLESV